MNRECLILFGFADFLACIDWRFDSPSLCARERMAVPLPSAARGGVCRKRQLPFVVKAGGSENALHDDHVPSLFERTRRPARAGEALRRSTNGGSPCRRARACEARLTPTPERARSLVQLHWKCTSAIGPIVFLLQQMGKESPYAVECVRARIVVAIDGNRRKDRRMRVRLILFSAVIGAAVVAFRLQRSLGCVERIRRPRARSARLATLAAHRVADAQSPSEFHSDHARRLDGHSDMARGRLAVGRPREGR